MVLRINFSNADLRRIRLAGGPDPLWELALSADVLRSPTVPAHYRSWQRKVRGELARDQANQCALRVLNAIVPGGNFPDFLTPPNPEGDEAAGFELILGTPRTRITEDVERTFRRASTPPRWARELAGGDQSRLRQIVAALRQYHRFALSPDWRATNHRVQVDRGLRAQQLLGGGVDGLLANLHHSIRWVNPTLIADYPFDHTIDLAGRGLILTPAHFCWGAPVTYIDRDLTPILVYPADAEVLDSTDNQRSGGLGRLIGCTRARLLADVELASSTTQLAQRMNISAAAVSQHMGVLRDSGLVCTVRTGRSVRHTLTPLGRGLLDGDTVIKP